jgi:hypothetical protein
MKFSILVLLVFGFFAKVSATPLVYGLGEFPVSPQKSHREVLIIIPTYLDSKVCDGAVTLASIWIGEAKDVEIRSVFCPNLHQRGDVQHMLEQPRLETAPPLGKNVCGKPCRSSHDFSFKFLKFILI